MQYSKVAKLVKMKGIKNIVNIKKREALNRRRRWENSLRINLRPKTTNYLQKVSRRDRVRIFTDHKSYIIQ